ncbi:hypothetical protein [Delftia sp. RIT313]|uniref:hypothetical protein n=1 Tax=Delftia sp. RIT313 TaxID=1468410 RepID=UPI000450162D|nr:hypothetical protein [Delftia sp. RIT313]EZP51437.1 hypothetical protein BW39_03906 [Delftia sp. RIT313]
MSEAINSRPGPWLSEGNWTYTLQHAGWRRGEEQFENRLFAQVQPGRNSSLAEANPIASLFAEAGNVFHETGLTPRQLVEQRDALLAEIEREYTELSDFQNEWHGRNTEAGQAKLCRLRALIAKTTGRDEQDVQDDYGTRTRRAALQQKERP